jgi:hypothetical protein
VSKLKRSKANKTKNQKDYKRISLLKKSNASAYESEEEKESGVKSKSLNSGSIPDCDLNSEGMAKKSKLKHISLFKDLLSQTKQKIVEFKKSKMEPVNLPKPTPKSLMVGKRNTLTGIITNPVKMVEKEVADV